MAAKKSKKAKKPAKKKAARKPAKAKARKAAPKKSAAKKSAPKKAPRAAKAKKKAAAPAGPAPLPWRVPLEGEKKVGVVDDFFGHISVIALTLEQPLKVGDRVHVHGHTTDLTQTVESLQIGHESVTSAEAGAAIGIKVSDKCRKGDWVFKAT